VSKYYKIWKQFLTEGQMSPHQIYCDMDGVLVDFVKGALVSINEDVNNARLPDKKESGGLNDLGRLRRAMQREGVDTIVEEHIEKFAGGHSNVRKFAIRHMYTSLSDDVDFWSNLPWMEGGRELWNAIKKYDPYILTAPMGPGSEKGKRQWIMKNLSPAPQKIFMSHDKYKWATTNDGHKNILIDDFMTNIKPWDQAGGIAIHHRASDIQETFAELTRHGIEVLRAPESSDDDGRISDSEDNNDY
jgi:hypothetical protein